MESYDEKVDGIFSGIFPSTYIPEASLGSRVFIAQFETIKKLASDHSCVIVGRCADYVLRDFENVVNVFITASDDYCVKLACKYYGLEEKKALEEYSNTDSSNSALGDALGKALKKKA